jgi:hypothetical protein
MARNIRVPAFIQRLPRWIWGAAAILPVAAVSWGYSATRRTDPPAPKVKVKVKVAGSRQEHKKPAKAVKPPRATLPVASVLAFPNRYEGEDIHGTATISRMEGDRAFWVRANGKKAFVVLSETLGPPPAELAAGRQVKLQGRVWRPSRMAEIPEITQLDEGVLDQVRGQRAILEATHLKWTGL